jgi:hypothetical protein
MTKPPLQNILKEILHTEDENKHNHKREVLNLMRRTNTQKVELNWLYTLKSLNNKHN